MNKHSAFTLVELLVVIAIIALLMSILMPALGRIRQQAKAVLCESHLRQWGLVFSMYTNDNDGYFMNGKVDPSSPYWWEAGGGGGMGSWWFIILQPYYKDAEIRLCPMATKTYDEGGRVPFGAWLTWLGDPGSYGPNGYIINPPPEEDFILGRPTKDNWKQINVKGAYNIPLLLDAMWVDAWPLHTDIPQEVVDWFADEPGVDEMRRFCMDRHNGHANALFFDCSVRKVPLKCLWKLKWHRAFDINGGPTEEEFKTEAPWMASLPPCK